VKWTKTSRKKCRHCGQLILRTISKFDSTRCQILRLKCTKFEMKRMNGTIRYRLRLRKDQQIARIQSRHWKHGRIRPEKAFLSLSSSSFVGDCVASRKRAFHSSNIFAATAWRNDVTRCKLQPINAPQLTRCSQSASSRSIKGEHRSKMVIRRAASPSAGSLLSIEEYPSLEV